MFSACYISYFAAASTLLSTSHYVMYHAQAPNAPTAAVYWVKHPSSQPQLKHTTDIYLHFLKTICKTSAHIRRWYCSPWTPHTAFHNFCTLPDVRRLCGYNKNWTMEESRTSVTHSGYKYLHILTLKNF